MKTKKNGNGSARRRGNGLHRTISVKRTRKGELRVFMRYFTKPWPDMI